MTSSSERDKDYHRGYYAAATRKWRAHKPPYPPEPLVRELMQAASRLREIADTECARFEIDDPMVKNFDAGIAAVDSAMEKITEWLKGPPPTEEASP